MVIIVILIMSIVESVIFDCLRSPSLYRSNTVLPKRGMISKCSLCHKSLRKKRRGKPKVCFLVSQLNNDTSYKLHQNCFNKIINTITEKQVSILPLHKDIEPIIINQLKTYYFDSLGFVYRNSNKKI